MFLKHLVQDLTPANNNSNNKKENTELMNKNIPIWNNTGQEYYLQLSKELSCDNNIDNLVLQH